MLQTALDFLSTDIQGRFHMKSKQNENRKGIMLIRTFVLKVINNERKILTHREIIDPIAGKIVSLQRIKIVHSSKLTVAKFLIYL